MANDSSKFPMDTVLIIGFSFNIVQDIIIRHDVVKEVVFTRRCVLLKLNLELTSEWVLVEVGIELVDQFHHPSSGHITSLIRFR